MKKYIVFVLFAAAASLAAILRFCQMLAFTEYQTGFIKRDGYFIYILLAAIIGVLALGVSVFAVILTPTPKKNASFGRPARLPGTLMKVALLVSEFIMCGACTLDVLFLSSSANDVPHFLKVVCVALGFLCAAYFGALGLRSFLYFPFSSKFAAIPPAFLTVRAACLFISCSRHAVVSDNVFEVFIFCASMLLFLEIARAANGAGSKSSAKRIVFFGLLMSLLAICFSLPKIALSVFYNAALHDSVAGCLLTLALGLYSAAFVFSRVKFSGRKKGGLGVYYQGKH